jgi:hypothetical protein
MLPTDAVSSAVRAASRSASLAHDASLRPSTAPELLLLLLLLPPPPMLLWRRVLRSIRASAAWAAHTTRGCCSCRSIALIGEALS